MVKETTYEKIREIELRYGSLVNALDANAITNSKYYRYRTISMTKEYADYVLNKFYSLTK